MPRPRGGSTISFHTGSMGEEIVAAWMRDDFVAWVCCVFWDLGASVSACAIWTQLL